MSAQQLITDHLDIWTAAHKTRSGVGRGSSNKLDLYGIKKLRELILELAVRGKLVPQDPNDEPASELLNRISLEEERLVKEGKHKKDKNIAELTEIPFELPNNWIWTHLNLIGMIGSSSRVHQKDWTSSGVPFYRAREIVELSKYGTVDNELFISEDLYRELSKSGFCPTTNDVMITGVGTIGVPYVVKEQDVFYFKDASVLIFKNIYNFPARYLELFFKSPFWFSAIHEQSMGTTVHTLTIGRAKETPIPIPPLAEQHRIVAKVDELMAFCDQLEQTQSDNITAHAKLVETLLATLTNSSDHNDLQNNWQRIAAHFDTLFTTEHSIDQLKQTILQLAVMGKLVPQNPNDEPASELLKKIAAEKAQLIKEGKIKKEKPLPEITDEEKPFELPSGWECIRLGQIAAIKGGKRLPNGHGFSVEETPHVYIRVTDMKNGTINDEGLVYIRPETQSLISQYVISSNDLYITIAGTIGAVGVVPQQFDGMNLTENAAKIIFRGVEKSWLQKTLSSSYIQEQFNEKTNQLAQPKLALHRIESSVVFLPPLAEQHRIATKVDELMSLCGTLKTNLQNVQTTQLALADALVEQAVL